LKIITYIHKRTYFNVINIVEILTVNIWMFFWATGGHTVYSNALNTKYEICEILKYTRIVFGK